MLMLADDFKVKYAPDKRGVILEEVVVTSHYAMTPVRPSLGERSSL